MKRCPKCNTVFEDTLVYCTEDGEILSDDNFILPSESLPNETEEETIIHHDPIKIDIPSVAIIPEQIPPPIAPRKKIIPVIFRRRENETRSFFYLMLGLLLGLALALGILVLFLLRPRNSNTEKPAENIQITVGKHNVRNQTRKDSEFNGFVLSDNANIRSAPNSAPLESLPKNDRLNILERDGSWYRVVCEHGVNGWMHGNTIRFNDDAAAF